MNSCPHQFQKPPERTRIYFDAEFTGLHRNTTLLSIGLYCREIDASFYAEFDDFDKDQLDKWLIENIYNNCIFQAEHHGWKRTNDPINLQCPSIETFGDRSHIKNELLRWLDRIYQQTNRKIQFYTDCYAYDWMLLNDLICEDGKALNLPDYIDYIPIDLSTYFQLAGIDPDISREEYLGEAVVNTIKKAPMLKPFVFKGSMKHNSLWDAVVASLCFFKLDTRYWQPPADANHRIWDPVIIQASAMAIPDKIKYKINHGIWKGELEHPTNPPSMEMKEGT